MGTLLIKAGRLFDGLADTVREQAFVTVEDDRITGVGLQKDLGESGESNYQRVVDLGQDGTVMPGLINMHTHMTFSAGGSVLEDAIHDSDEVRMIRAVENLRESLACGVTTVRDCGSPPHIALAARDAVASSLLSGPRIVTSGAITTTGGHCWYCSTEADDEDTIRKAVRDHVKNGVDFIKLFATGGNLTPGTNSVEAQFTEAQMCAATEEARRLGRRSASHAHGTQGVRNSIAARVTTIEHCSFQTPEGIGWEEDLAKQVADLGIYVCHTVFRGLGKLKDDPNYHFSEQEEAMLAARDQRLVLTKRLAEKGVKLVSGNDAGVTHCAFGDYPADLVHLADGCGFAPAYVLKTATSVAAEALGRDDLGVLAAGKSADLLGVRGNPAEDIRAILQPQLIVARGQMAHAPRSRHPISI